MGYEDVLAGRLQCTRLGGIDGYGCGKQAGQVRDSVAAIMVTGEGGIRTRIPIGRLRHGDADRLAGNETVVVIPCPRLA